MRDSSEALGRGAPGDAVGPETEALDALQQATKDMMDQMTGAFGGPGGFSDLPDGAMPNAERDPLGRPPATAPREPIPTAGYAWAAPTSTASASSARRRSWTSCAGAPATPRWPEIERDYIDRLLRRF